MWIFHLLSISKNVISFYWIISKMWIFQFSIFVNFDVAWKCFKSVPLALYFMSVFTNSWLSICTISCKCIFGGNQIYVKYSYRFRINLFFGENVTMNVCVCAWQCLNHFRTVWNVTIVRNLPNWISILTPIGPHLTIFHPILTQF